MKKTFLMTRLMTLAIFSILLITGCKKETSDQLSPEQEQEAADMASESQTESEFVFNDVFDNVMGVNAEVGLGGTGVFGKRMASDGSSGREMDLDSTHCFTVQKTHLNQGSFFPVKIILDFGNGCMGADGHMRYGKIITIYTARLINAGAIATTTFENFKIDQISVQGTLKITNTTGNTPGANQKQYTITVRDARLSKPNGNYTEWRSDRVLTQVEGNGTFLPLDDVLRIEGSAKGRVKRGNVLVAWQSEITEPLIKKFTCPWISKGVVRTRRENLSSSSQWVAALNFGTGACDYFATLTINGVTHNIELPH
ncbi:MAG: hypothetical protein ACXWB9_07250 [Flavisolibacter sp.]